MVKTEFLINFLKNSDPLVINFKIRIILDQTPSKFNRFAPFVLLNEKAKQSQAEYEQLYSKSRSIKVTDLNSDCELCLCTWHQSDQQNLCKDLRYRKFCCGPEKL